MLVLETPFGWLLKKQLLDLGGREDYNHDELFKTLKILEIHPSSSSATRFISGFF